MTARVELTVEGLAAGGEGLARLDSGRVVFVPRTAPGDRVLAELTEDRARWARGRVVELRSGGASRVSAPCSHYDDCGGCHLQHVDADTQLRGLRQAVSDALGRIGGREVTVRPVAAAQARYGYRNRVTLTLRRGQGRVVAGYHRLRGPELVDVEDCLLAEPAVRSAWRELRAGWGRRARALPHGKEVRLTLRGSADGELALSVEGGDAPGEPEQVMAAIPSLRSYWWRPTGDTRRLLAGDPVFAERWQGMRVLLGPHAFLQVNRTVAEALEGHLDAEVGALTGRRVLDLYGGVGTRAARWAGAGAEVTTVESEPDAIEASERLSREVGVSWSIRSGRVEDAIDALLPVDTVVVNPPRSGLSRSVTARLASGGVGQLVYVSCDPATLGRDLKRLGDAWVPRFAQPFDAFPQTGHVETVLWLDRAGSAA